MKRIIVVLIALGLVLASTTVVQAQEPVYIGLQGGPDYYSVAHGTSISVYTAWAACTRGLVEVYQTAYNLELTMDGVPKYELYTAQNDPYWLLVKPFEGVDWTCITAPAGNQKSAMFWIYPLGDLDPGTYEIHVKDWLDRSITDGFDVDGDGGLDFYEGLLTDRTITLVVYD